LLSAKVEAEMASKIQLYSLATPNGMKIGIALEEMGLEYDAHVINILKNDNFTPEFIAVNPNSKIPAIVDPDGPGELVMFCASPMLCFFHIVCFFWVCID
jgi:GST-like protein